MKFVGDCANCVGLCCVALARSRAGGFGADASAGTPCHHLQPDNRCEIHATLREDGWPSCAAFDCFGAGQQVTQVTFGGPTDWRDGPGAASEMFSAFGTMRHLMEMLRLVTEARELATATTMETADELHTTLNSLVSAPAGDLAGIDIPALRERVGAVLQVVSQQCRQPEPHSKNVRPRALLLGADLHGRDLSRHTLRGALLIQADLRQATLARTDLLGADLRDADLSGADLSEALFLTQQQVNTARGDARTLLPPGITRPRHWS